MDTQAILARLRENKATIAAQGVAHVAWFGSRGRGEAGPGSDIMVEIAADGGVDLFGYVGIVQYIEELFPVRVDVANRDGPKALVRPHVQRDAIYAF